MPKPACVKCRRFFRPKKNGFVLTEGMPADGVSNPEYGALEGWQPYKVWLADLWECPGCGVQIVSGYAPHPLAERHESNFASELALSQMQVNDC
jgi:hypothetical protein